MKKRTLLVPLESWIYLQDQSCIQRVGQPHTDKYKEHLKKEMEKPHNKNGHMLFDGDLGGAIGKPENSWEEGRWTNWSIDEMKKMLDEQDLPYKDGEPVDVISAALW